MVVVGGWALSRTMRPVAYVPLGVGDTYLALGDSLAAGFTTNDPAESYVGRIATHLRQVNPQVKVTNLAIPGETSRSFRGGQLDRARAFIAAEQKAGRRVSPITIDIGGNDARAIQRSDQAARRAEVKRFSENLQYSLDELIAVTRDAAGHRTSDIAIMTYYNPYGGDLADQDSPAYWTDQFNQAITRIATVRGVAVADVATAFGGGLVYRYTYVATGDIHANADGHLVIAEQFWKALRY